MKVFFIILLTLPITMNAQKIAFEQKAFDHFFNTVFEKEYSDVNDIQFDGITEKELSRFNLYPSCFSDEVDILVKLDENAYGKSLSRKEVDITKTESVYISHKKVASGIKMYVSQANQLEDKFYVMLELIKNKEASNVYFYEMDATGKILRWCKTGNLQ